LGIIDDYFHLTADFVEDQSFIDSLNSASNNDSNLKRNVNKSGDTRGYGV